MDAAMTINGSVQEAGVTQFANEACDGVSVLGRYMPSKLVTAQANIQDIKEYFARPRLVTRGTVAFGTNATISVTDFGADQATLKTIFPQWSQRLAGAYGIRFTLNFRVQVAATAFHQGILALCWQYTKVGVSDSTYSRGRNVFTCTNLPHVRLDISEQTMVELQVPFMYPSEFMEVEQVASTQYGYPYGQLTLNSILSSNSVIGLVPAPFDLYCYMTDIELFGVDVINPTFAVLQSGGGLITTEVKKSRVISGTLSNMAKIGSFVAKGVPSLAAIAGPAAWALDTASGIAKYFGYSKPMVQDPAVKMLDTRYAGDCHVDTPAVGEVVGMFQGNTTTIDTSLGATDVDEMALAFVTQQWSQICRISVSTTDLHANFIYTSPVSPSVMWFRAGSTLPFSNKQFPRSAADLLTNTGNSFMPSSLMYISSFFRLWKGSFRYRFTFAKTKLHGGRYMVTYNPYASFEGAVGAFGSGVLGPETVSGLMQPYGNSLIMDLKDGNVFEFEVPYTSQSPYLNFTSSMGGIMITCVDPLQATATVATTVQVLIEVCASHDFELADYAGPYYPLHPAGTVYTQSGGSLVKPVAIESCSNTIGECVKSVKQMIQMPQANKFSIATGVAFSSYIAPWFVYTPYNAVQTMSGLPNSNNISGAFEGGGSAGATLAKCYAFCKGGTDLHVYPQSGSVVMRVQQVAQEYTAPGTTQGTPFLDRRCFPSAAPNVMSCLSTAMHVRLPSYQSYVRIPTSAFDAAIEKPLFTQLVAGIPPIITHFNKLYIDAQDVINAERVTTNRSAADDASLAHYIGPVPIFIPNNVSTNPIEADLSL